MSKSQRAYCFTSYDNLKPTLNENIRYLIYQIEMCPKTNKLHCQGYAEFPKKITIKKAQEFLNIGKSHCERRIATREKARDYCRKIETRIEGPFEYGD